MHNPYAQKERVFNIKVQFAHGIEHEFKEVKSHYVTAITAWRKGNTDQFLVIMYKGTEYTLNRDYVCTVLITDVTPKAY